MITRAALTRQAGHMQPVGCLFETPELDAIIEDPEDWAEIKALRSNFRERRMFNANNGSVYQTRTSSGGSNSSNSNLNQGNGESSNPSGPAPKRNTPAFGKTCHYCKKKNYFQATVTSAIGKMGPWPKWRRLKSNSQPWKPYFFQKTWIQILYRTERELHQ